MVVVGGAVVEGSGGGSGRQQWPRGGSCRSQNSLALGVKWRESVLFGQSMEPRWKKA